MNTAELTALFVAHWRGKQARNRRSPRFVPLLDVADSVGWDATRRADAVVLDCWKSAGAGPALHGFEFKVSESDYRRELADLSKSQAVSRYCHTWTLVTAPGVVPDTHRHGGKMRVPEGCGWGLWIAEGDSLRELIKPKRHEPDPMPMRFIASLTRRAFVTETP